MRILGHELTLHKIEVLCLVADLESVSLAAEKLRIAQPVVTAHLRSIEKKIGVQITYRAGRRIAFTEDGLRVVRWAREVLSRTHELDRELAESRAGIQGSAVVATSMSVGSYCLPDTLVSFRQKNPASDIAVSITTPRVVVNAVLNGDADMGLSILNAEIDTSGLEMQIVGQDELVLVAVPDVSARWLEGGLEDIRSLPFVTAARGSTRRQIEDSLLAGIGLSRPNIFLELGHAEAIHRVVKTGAGAAFLFRTSISEELASGQLAEIGVSDLDGRVPIYLLRKQNKHFSPFQDSLYSFLKDAFNSSMAAAATSNR